MGQSGLTNRIIRGADSAVHWIEQRAASTAGLFARMPRPPANRYTGLGLAGVVALGAVALLPASDRAALVSVEPASAAVPSPVASIDLSRFDMALTRELSVPALERKRISIKPGDSLGPILSKAGLKDADVTKFVSRFSDQFSPRRLRAGQSFDLYYADGQLTDVTFRPSVDKTVFVARKGEDWHSRTVEADFRYETVTVRADIENSLYVDATRLGAPDKVVAQFANIYEYSVDFQRDIQPGDKFEMFFEVARDTKGNIVKAGDLLYTSFSPRGQTSEYYLFEGEKGRENFYDADGKTAKRKLRATPINGARLSSSFGKRRHPILGFQKMHFGVDFAAPRGTPILAAGSGTVERANRFGSFGNYIRLRHSDGYQTAYAHLKGFAPGIKAGASVRQDQVIGYVGTTGRSTGPHLHYEVIHKGKKINPRRLSQLSGKPLSQTQMAAFSERREAIDAQRDVAPVIERRENTGAILTAALPN